MKNHMFVVAFTVESERDHDKLSKLEMVGGMMKRAVDLIGHWEPEAFEWSDTYEFEEEK